MSERQIDWIRWLAVVPIALLATVIVKIGSEAVFRYVLVVMTGLEPWTPWVAKGLASLLMGAVFVLAVRCIAPYAKVIVSALALGAVIVWGAAQILGSLEVGGLTAPVAMGFGGVLGGALVFETMRRVSRTRAD